MNISRYFPSCSLLTPHGASHRFQRDWWRDFKTAAAELAAGGAAVSSENKVIADDDGTSKATGARLRTFVLFFLAPTTEELDGSSALCSFSLVGDVLTTTLLAGARFAAAGFSAGG